MDKLSTEELLEVYKEAIRSNVGKDFIRLIAEELNKKMVATKNNEFENSL